MRHILILILVQFIFSRSLDVKFYSENEWLYGRSWNQGTTFYNSISYGSGLVGQSLLEESEVLDIDIIFSNNPDSLSLAPVYSAENFSYIGYGTFPGMAFDVSNPEYPRRINLAFFEQENGNLLWDPIDIVYGNYEYLLVMQSNYDETGTSYSEISAYNEDVMYFCWLRLRPGQEWFSSIPAKLEFRNFWEFSSFYLESSDSKIELFWQHEYPEFEQEEISNYIIYRGEGGSLPEQIAIVGSETHHYVDTNVINGNNYIYYISGIDENEIVQITTDEISGVPIMNILNVNLISNWDEGHDATAVTSVSVYNDIWGYESEDGVEYALIGGFDGTYIVDVSSNMNDPQLVSFIQGSYSSHRDIKTYGNYMYVGTEANRADPDTLAETGQVYKLPQGIQVVDLTNPENASLVYEWDGVVQSHNIMEADGYLYVIGSNQQWSHDGEQQSWGLDDLIILDLESNPSMPIKVGGWSGEYLHDVCIKNDILYGCGIYSESIIAFDISDKFNPQLITQWYGIPSSHACWISDDGNTLFSASETTGGHIMSWDVSDLENVEYLDEWMPSGGENYSAHNLFIKDNYLFISYYLFGLQVLDITNPSNLIHVGAYDTYLQNSSYIYNGAWGVYPYLGSGNILISDRQTGLYVLDFEVEILQNDKVDYINKFKINKVYPNPANPRATVSFNIKEAGMTSIDLVNIKGEKVATTFLGNLYPGQNQKNIDLSYFPSGIYWLSIKQYKNGKFDNTNSIPVTILK
ncbi:MAG: hypothetical protein CMF96_12850 [Candidatus Marinimicrobia bacterium]|mgnify:CR=1 FL=1|nr:hypothetical protein [Candidatus Neomarinimicrobiota bacterium]